MTWMTDIYGIQPLLLDNFINYKISFIYLIVIILILLFLYYIYEKNKIKVSVIDNSPIINKRDFSIDLDLLYEKYLSAQRELFYSKLLWILRDYLEYKTWKHITKMTLDELKSLKLNNNLYKIISSLYYKEYSDNSLDDNLDERKKLIEKIKNIIK